MSKLNVDQKSVKDLFQNNKADFLIPDYQRPYAWEDKECQTLWDDIFAFAPKLYLIFFLLYQVQFLNFYHFLVSSLKF